MPNEKPSYGVHLDDKVINWPQPDSRGYVTQTGVPLSVAVTGELELTLAAVLMVEGKPLLGYVVNTGYLTGTQVQALLQSEIVDGDADMVTWAGIPKEDGLVIKELYVHGYRINFR